VSESYIRELERRGLRVLHKPTLDFHPVELYDLVESVLFIDEVVSSGGRVLVHCAGGVGRSSVVTTGYLLYRGLNLYDAVTHVRSRVPGALEVSWQLTILEDFSDLLSALGRSRLSFYVRVLRELGLSERSTRHLFKVFQLTAELARSLSPGDRRVLMDALLHVHSSSVRSELSARLGVEVSSEESLLVSLAHSLDYDESSRVVVVGIDETDPSCTVIRALCDEPCSDVVSEASKLRSNLEEVLKRRFIIEWAEYTNYTW